MVRSSIKDYKCPKCGSTKSPLMTQADICIQGLVAGVLLVNGKLNIKYIKFDIEQGECQPSFVCMDCDQEIADNAKDFLELLDVDASGMKKSDHNFVYE